MLAAGVLLELGIFPISDLLGDLRLPPCRCQLPGNPSQGRGPCPRRGKQPFNWWRYWDITPCCSKNCWGRNQLVQDFWLEFLHQIMSPEFNGGWVVLVKYDEIHAEICGSSLTFPKIRKKGISSFYMSNWNQNDSIDYGYLWVSNDWATQNLEALASMFDIISGSLGQRDLAQLMEQKTVCKTWSPFIPSLVSSKRHDHIASIYWYVFFSLCWTSYTATFDSMILEQWVDIFLLQTREDQPLS